MDAVREVVGRNNMAKFSTGPVDMTHDNILGNSLGCLGISLGFSSNRWNFAIH